MNRTIRTIAATLGPIARRVINYRHNGAGSRGVWLESHLQQYTDAVRALGNR